MTNIPPDRKLEDFELRIVDAARTAPKRGISRKELYAKLGVTRWAVTRTLRRLGLTPADLPGQVHAKCKHCGRVLAGPPRKDGRPSFCDWTVSKECYTAYRNWMYKHDKKFRNRKRAYDAVHRMQRREQQRASQQLPDTGDVIPQPVSTDDQHGVDERSPRADR